MTTTPSNTTTTAADAAKARVNQGYIYLASPYSHASKEIRQARHETVCEVAAELMLGGHVVYCPIAHGVAITENAVAGWEMRYWPHARWMQQCYPLLTTAAELWLLQMEGWRESLGIALEVAHARALGIPIKASSTDGDVWAPFPPEADDFLVPVLPSKAAAA